jgi:hypothetical protein
LKYPKYTSQTRAHQRGCLNMLPLRWTWCSGGAGKGVGEWWSGGFCGGVLWEFCVLWGFSEPSEVRLYR